MSKSIIIDGVAGTWTETSQISPEDPALPEGYLSPHFQVAEMSCNHCGQYGELASMDLIAVLERVREHFGHPVIINSGVRCDTHNQNVGGASNSRHKTEYADAADIVVRDVNAGTVADYLESLDPGEWGIGRYPSQGFTHIDVRGYSARWTG